MAAYESNSYKARDGKVEHVDPITGAPARVRKKGEMRKFLDAFITEDAATIKSHLLNDVVVPYIKKTLLDIVKTVLYPSGKDPDAKPSIPEKISYYNYAQPSNPYAQTAKKAARFTTDDVIVSTEEEARAVLNRMNELIHMNGAASVARFYELVRLPSQYTDNDWGWNDIHDASIVNLGDGYMIRMPKARPLE